MAQFFSHAFFTWCVVHKIINCVSSYASAFTEQQMWGKFNLIIQVILVISAHTVLRPPCTYAVISLQSNFINFACVSCYTPAPPFLLLLAKLRFICRAYNSLHFTLSECHGKLDGRFSIHPLPTPDAKENWYYLELILLHCCWRGTAT